MVAGWFLAAVVLTAAQVVAGCLVYCQSSHDIMREELAATLEDLGRQLSR